MNLLHLLLQQAEATPDRPALVAPGGETTTWRGLVEASARAAAAMQRAGLRAGDTVLVLVPMSAALYAVLGAVWRLGMVAVVPDAGMDLDALRASLRKHPLRAFVGTPKAHLLRLLAPEVRRLPLRFTTGAWLPGATPLFRVNEGLPGVAEVHDDAPALYTFTSGSTGTPRVVVRSHGLLCAQYEALHQALALTPGEVDLATLPIFVLANLAAGVTTVLPDADMKRVDRVDAGPLLAQMRRHGVTRTTASPAFLQRLMDHPDAAALGRLRRVFLGGAPVWPDAIARLRRAAPEASITTVYGSSEAEPVAHIEAGGDGEAEAGVRDGRGLLVGRPVEAVRLRIVQDRWGTPLGPLTSSAISALALPAGQTGEIVVAGAHVVPGYLGGEGEATAKVDVDGVRWHRTGDAGYLDAEGRLWLMGRCAARIDGLAGPVYPFAVEGPARTMAEGRRVAVVPGLRPVLAVEGGPAQGAALEGLARRAGLAGVLHVDRIPMDRRHAAKVDYPALAKLADTDGKS